MAVAQVGGWRHSLLDPPRDFEIVLESQRLSPASWRAPRSGNVAVIFARERDGRICRSSERMIADAERVAAFVREHSPLAFCPPCIGRRLRLDIEAATLAVAEVGLRTGYGFKVGACSHCEKTDLLLVVEVVA